MRMFSEWDAANCSIIAGPGAAVEHQYPAADEEGEEGLQEEAEVKVHHDRACRLFHSRDLISGLTPTSARQLGSVMIRAHSKAYGMLTNDTFPCSSCVSLLR